LGGAADAEASVGALVGDNSVWLERVAVPVFGAFGVTGKIIYRADGDGGGQHEQTGELFHGCKLR
jgi:hypothetical protein